MKDKHSFLRFKLRSPINLLRVKSFIINIITNQPFLQNSFMGSHTPIKMLFSFLESLPMTLSSVGSSWHVTCSQQFLNANHGTGFLFWLTGNNHNDSGQLSKGTVVQQEYCFGFVCSKTFFFHQESKLISYFSGWQPRLKISWSMQIHQWYSFLQLSIRFNEGSPFCHIFFHSWSKWSKRNEFLCFFFVI